MKLHPSTKAVIFAAVAIATMLTGRQADLPMYRMISTSAIDSSSINDPGGPVAPLHLIRSIPLQGVKKRIDHMAVNVGDGQLFIAALGNDSLEVVSLRNGYRVQSIHGLHEPQGIAYVPDFARVFVANGGSGECSVFQVMNLHLTQSIKLGEDADNVRYDPTAKRIYIGFGEGALAILNPDSGKKLGLIKLAGHPESFQIETSGSRIFVNVPTAAHIAVADRLRQSIVTTWPLEGAESNFPLGLDEPGNRLFVGCRKPPKLLVYDTTTGKKTGSLPIGGDTDDLFWDAVRKRIHVICGSGIITSFQETEHGTFKLMAETVTAPGARTGLFVPETGCLYVAVPQQGEHSAEIRVFSVL